MSDAKGGDDAFVTALGWRENWWKVTSNPLYAWEAIAMCLAADPPYPLPAWCVPYLAEAARRLTLLSWGRDWREGKPEPLPDEALGLVSTALSLVKQGQKNAFSRVQEDAEMQRNALAEDRGFLQADDVARLHNVGLDRAKRKLVSGRRLIAKR